MVDSITGEAWARKKPAFQRAVSKQSPAAHKPRAAGVISLSAVMGDSIPVAAIARWSS
jgi:hypothetical protein